MSEIFEAPNHPQVRVKLLGEDGNGFLIACRVRSALRGAGITERIAEMFFEEALSGDYPHLLATVQNWVTVE